MNKQDQKQRKNAPIEQEVRFSHNLKIVINKKDDGASSGRSEEKAESNWRLNQDGCGLKDKQIRFFQKTKQGLPRISRLSNRKSCRIFGKYRVGQAKPLALKIALSPTQAVGPYHLPGEAFLEISYPEAVDAYQAV